MSDRNEGYDLAPDSEGEPTPDPKDEPRDDGAESDETAKYAATSRGKIDKPGLLEDFDEDEDFDDDPEEQAERKPLPKARLADTDREPGRAPKVLADEDDAEGEAKKPFVEPGIGSPYVWAIVAGVLTVAAAVAGGITTPGPRVAAVLLTIYNIAFHTGTGVAAVFVAARVLSRPFGQVELAAARMATAVASFALLANLNIALLGTSRWEELVLATIVYVGWVAALFRLWGRELGIVVCAHFGLWVLIGMGVLLSQWASPASTAG